MASTKPKKTNGSGLTDLLLGQSCHLLANTFRANPHWREYMGRVYILHLMQNVDLPPPLFFEYVLLLIPSRCDKLQRNSVKFGAKKPGANIT